MQLYDSARRGVYPLEVGPVVTLYSCGITPYDAAHLGHAFVYLAFDVLVRRLTDLGHDARCVRNVTDVDDDILRKAREPGGNYLHRAAGLLRAARDVGDLGDPHLDRGDLRPRRRLRSEWCGLLRRRHVPAFRSGQSPGAPPDARTRGRTRGPTRRPQQARPTR